MNSKLVALGTVPGSVLVAINSLNILLLCTVNWLHLEQYWEVSW